MIAALVASVALACTAAGGEVGAARGEVGAARGDETLPDELFAGCWRDRAHPERLLLLEAGRIRELVDGELTFHRADFDVDHLIRHDWGRRERWELTIDGEEAQLVVTAPAGERRFTCVAPAAVPEALTPQPLKLADRKALTAEQLASLHAEFARRKELDQAVRSHPTRKPEHNELAEMERVDRDNTAWLSARVGELGWIDVERFGDEAALAAFLIVQHSGDLPLMLAALPEIERDVRHHGLDGQNFALLWDRLSIRLGRRQRYGSQIGQDEQRRLTVVALEDRAAVDQLRHELGLPPLKSYLSFFEKGPPPQVVVFEDDRVD